MYKVVFIDDEALVKIGLQSSFDLKVESLDVVGEAEDGREGLQLILQKEPDLVITDIVMPEMDGLEMIQKAKEQGSRAVFIVLSSFDEFELVKKAMQLGARDYILKLKISKGVLKEVLDNITGEMEELSRKRKSTGEKRGHTVWEMEGLRSTFFENLLSGQYREETAIKEQAESLDIVLDESQLRVLYVVSDIYRQLNNRNGTEKKLYALTIRGLIQDICREFFDCYCVQWEDGKYLVIVSADEKKETNANLKLMGEAVIDMLGQYGNIRASIGISKKAVGFVNLDKAYNQAKVVLEYLFSEGYGKIFFYDYTHAVKKKEITFDSLDEKKVEVVCESLDWPGFASLRDKIIRELRKNCLARENACFQCSKFMYMTEEGLGPSWRSFSPRHSLDDYMYQMYHAGTVDEIIQVFKNYCGDVELFMDEFHEDDTERLVREARRFIKEHVYESIGLKEVAEALHISAGYLSGTFSKYEPGGLANYINQIKIAEAQKLLKKERLKVYEVSFRLGYENSGYFAKIFKKYTGCTPKEYIEGK